MEGGLTPPCNRSTQRYRILATPDPVQKHILRILSAHRGSEGRILRGELLAELRRLEMELSDREMRTAIEGLRHEHPHGAWICADLRGGYFIASDEEELDRYLRTDERRAVHLLQRVRIQRQQAGLQSGEQLELFS